MHALGVCMIACLQAKGCTVRPLKIVLCEQSTTKPPPVYLVQPSVGSYSLYFVCPKPWKREFSASIDSPAQARHTANGGLRSGANTHRMYGVQFLMWDQVYLISPCSH
jgi:hypothetical protein